MRLQLPEEKGPSSLIFRGIPLTCALRRNPCPRHHESRPPFRPRTRISRRRSHRPRATDAYHAWAVASWGITIAGSDSARSTTWGESADPDKGGLPHLLEYATDTNPTARNPVTDRYVFTVPEVGAPQYRYPQLTTYLRQDDPDLRVIPQTSGDLAPGCPARPSISPSHSRRTPPPG